MHLTFSAARFCQEPLASCPRMANQAARCCDVSSSMLLRTHKSYEAFGAGGSLTDVAGCVEQLRAFLVELGAMYVGATWAKRRYSSWMARSRGACAGHGVWARLFIRRIDPRSAKIWFESQALDP